MSARGLLVLRTHASLKWLAPLFSSIVYCMDACSLAAVSRKESRVIYSRRQLPSALFIRLSELAGALRPLSLNHFTIGRKTHSLEPTG
jgi:hypothetical protein